MSILLVVVHVIVCFILIIVILLQAGRGQGLASGGMGGGGVQSLFGTRTADFLTKATSVAAVLFLFTCIGLDILETRRSRSLFETKKQQAVPVDVQQIQKVLEKIKAEEKAKADAKGQPVEAAKQVVNNAAAETKPAATFPVPAEQKK